MKLLQNKPEMFSDVLTVMSNALAFGSAKQIDPLAKEELKPGSTNGSQILSNVSHSQYLTGTFLGINDGYLAQ